MWYEDPFTRWEIKHGCLICLGSGEASCFSCLIILGHNFLKLWATAKHFWSGCKESAEFHIISRYYWVWMWDMVHFFSSGSWGICVILEHEIGFHPGSLLYGVNGSSWYWLGSMDPNWQLYTVHDLHSCLCGRVSHIEIQLNGIKNAYHGLKKTCEDTNHFW